MRNNDIFIIKALGYSDTFIVQLAAGPRHYETFFIYWSLLRRILSKLFHLISRSKGNGLT